MTTPTIPTQRHPAEVLEGKDARKAYPTLWLCPTCGATTPSCDRPDCVKAEIDAIVAMDRNEEASDE